MRIESLTFDDLLDQTAAKSPTPGGGSVAAAVGALGAALAAMVVAYSRGRKDLADHEPLLARAEVALKEARRDMLDLAQRDVIAYAELNDATRKPKEDPDRAARVVAAARAATLVPTSLAASCEAMLDLMLQLAGRSNKYLRSDLAIAAVLAEATAASARWNVLVNLPLLPPDEATLAREAVDRIVARCAGCRRAIESACV
jgi:formiminotetrahydrofolate cyclodeaminase